MANKTWKALERKVAAYFGAKGRTPLSGGNSMHGTSSDTLDEDLYIEVKHRAKHTLYTLYDETKANAIKEGKIPVCAIHEKGRKGFLCVVHSDDLEALVEELHSRLS